MIILERRNQLVPENTILRKEKQTKTRSKNYQLWKRMCLQMVICLCIYGVFYTITMNENTVSQTVLKVTQPILQEDVPLQEWYEKANRYVREWLFQKEKGESSETEQESIEQSKEQETQKEKLKKESMKETKQENVSISQEQKDIQNLKKNYSFIRPLKGRISSGFGKREVLISGMSENHKGIDISAKEGTKIKAAMEGQVVEVGNNRQSGNYIKIQQKDVMTVYAHCKKIKVSKGTKVKQGMVIATVGTTGITTGPHLHFEIRISNRYINPQSVIQFK